jgi:hypothetical protein
MAAGEHESGEAGQRVLDSGRRDRSKLLLCSLLVPAASRDNKNEVNIWMEKKEELTPKAHSSSMLCISTIYITCL